MEKSQGSQHGESWTAAAPRGSAQPRPFGRTLAGRGRRRRDLGAQRDWRRRKRGISLSERSRPARDPAKNGGTVRRSDGAAKSTRTSGWAGRAESSMLSLTYIASGMFKAISKISVIRTQSQLLCSLDCLLDVRLSSVQCSPVNPYAVLLFRSVPQPAKQREQPGAVSDDDFRATVSFGTL
jgi:hypothetical protein